MSDGEKQTNGFWSTVPGIITAIATLITAVGGLLIILKSVGLFDSSPGAAAVQTNDSVISTQQTVQNPDVVEAVYSKGRLNIRYPYSYDLDLGKE
ncbi:hypothetical protein [Daejeonella oryzae]|uniref:hypothetical protein n=1 Tax=Daejeonella oryzae TaxID=1122943 RepID=UPI000404605A|nr:hypothetical protein [Daejeonella oryzae]